MSHYTGWNRPLRVTLNATSNPYLADKLPLRGDLRVHEMATDGYAQSRAMTFQQVDEQGRPFGTAVAVDDAEFSYTGRRRARDGR